jgi:hypothetical protein
MHLLFYMQLLIDFIFNKGVFFQGEEFYYEKFGSREIHTLLSKITVPREVFIVNGPFYISGYRRSLMFAEAISTIYDVKIYGFDLLRDYSDEMYDSIAIKNKNFIKENQKFSIRKDTLASKTDYSLYSIAKKLSSLKLPHENLLLNWT